MPWSSLTGLGFGTARRSHAQPHRTRVATAHLQEGTNADGRARSHLKVACTATDRVDISRVACGQPTSVGVGVGGVGWVEGLLHGGCRGPLGKPVSDAAFWTSIENWKLAEEIGWRSNG